MLDNIAYYSGEEPRIGDKVKLSSNNDLDYYSPIRRDYSTVYEVKEIRDGIKSRLVKLGRAGYTYGETFYKASQFDLVERAGYTDAIEVPVSNKPSYIVVSSDYKTIIGRYDNSDTVNEVLRKILTSNPTNTYHVFEYDKTARTRPVEVQYDF